MTFWRAQIPRLLAHTLWVLAGVSGVSSVQAAVDGVEVARAQSRMSLHWENIRNPANWVTGPRPTRDAATGLFAVALDEGEEVAIHVASHAQLRIVALGDTSLAPAVALSQGTGLAVQRAPLPSEDGRSWLVRTESSQPSVIHLQGRNQHGAAQRYALFLAQFVEPPDAVVYRHELTLPGQPVHVRRADEARGKDHVRVPAGVALTTSVRGPERLMFEYRLESADPHHTALHSMEIALDGHDVRSVRQLTGLETAAPVRIDSEWRIASRRERFAMDVPPGEHTLELRSSHAIFIRAAAARAPDLLLPLLNQPPQWSNIEPDRAVEQEEQSAIAAAESNQWRDVARQAGERLLAQARQRPGVRSVSTAADELLGQFTQFQDLVPASGSASRIQPFVLKQPQPPDRVARQQLVANVTDLRADVLPAARWHPVGAQALRFEAPPVPYPVRLRFMVNANAGPTQLEIRHGDTALLLEAGGPRLSDEKLQVNAPLESLLTAVRAAPGADQSLETRPLRAPMEVTAVEWQLPPGTDSFTLRALDGEIEAAVQWAASTDYFLDDAFLALQLGSHSRATLAVSQRASALRPFKRMLAAARAQYVANLAPALPVPYAPDEAAARRVAAALADEIEPARSVELWLHALRVSAPPARAGALRGLARAQLAGGDRFGGERLLRSYWIGSDAVLARAAEEELRALYARENDAAMELLFASAVAAKDPCAYTRLSALLAASGDDRLALLAGVASKKRDLPALLQSALRIGYWQTYDVLLAHLPESDERRWWQAHRAVWQGQFDQAAHLFETAAAPDWADALRTGRELAGVVQSANVDRSGAVAQWQQWQVEHPGPQGWQTDPHAVTQHGGGLRLRSVALNLRSQWWRADARQPLMARVVGPSRVRIEARPLHSTPASVLDGWLQVRSQGQLWVVPFRANQISPGLVAENGLAWPGATITREIDLPAGLHELRIDAGGVPLAARVLQRRALLQLPVLPALTPAHFEPQAGVIARALPGSDCSGRSDCMLTVNEGVLESLQWKLETARWPGLPAPPRAVDPVARLLDAGDVDGALAQVADPSERMRLLLWLAHTDPAARPRALALGAELANRHPEAEIRSHWEQLSSSSGWVLSPLVDRSAGLRRIETAVGAPESPVGRMRAALLPTLRPGELRIGGDSRASFVSEQAQGYALRIEFALDELPGLPTLPLTLLLERNGKPWKTVELAQHARTATLNLKIPAGAQALSVLLQRPYANQSARVYFRGPVEPELTTSRDWHIATAAEPVRVTVAGPVSVRVDRLDADGVRSEERLVRDPIATLVLPPRAGAGESLYRVYRRVLQPGTPPNPPTRPNAYVPVPLAEAPDPWRATLQPQARAVHFTDAQPLTAQADYTLTWRAGLQRRRDGDAAGGDTAARSDRYAETGFNWRRGNEEDTQWSSFDGLLRRPEQGSAVLGLGWAAERLVDWSAERPWPFSVQGSVEGFLQSTPEGVGMSITARASASQTRALSATLSHTPSVGVLARWLSLNSVRDAALVDTDVFTRHRADHRRALVFSETLSWRPRRDSHLAAQVNLTTNPDLHFFRPDQMNVDLSWRQLVGRTRVEAGVRATRYGADGDRAKSSASRQWRLGTGTDWWFADGSRLEMVTHLSRNTSQSSFFGGIEFRWHWSAARQLRDFAPSELDFRALRSWQAPVVPNRIEVRQ
jgi:hypothetical protein